jgi:choline dehydrogenase
MKYFFGSIKKELMLPKNKKRKTDIIIIGGGTSGITLARKLSDKFNVVVFEQGDNNTDDPELAIPNLYSSLDVVRNLTNKYFCMLGHSIDKPRRFAAVEGQTLSGGSAVNGMQFSIGVPKTYDKIAKIAGDNSWDSNNAFRIYKDIQKFNGVYGEYNSIAHGTDGQINIRQATSNISSSQYFANTFANTFGTSNNVDYNDFSNETGSFVYWQLTQQPNKIRETSWTAFCSEAEEVKPGKYYARTCNGSLTVYINIRVIKLLFETCTCEENSKPRVTGVRLERNSNCYEFFSKKTIICSGFLSSTILLQNGIGPRNDLEKIGIEVIVNSPNVGKNIFNHPIVSLTGIPGDFNPLPAIPIVSDKDGLYSGGAVSNYPGESIRGFQWIGVAANGDPGTKPSSFTISTLILASPAGGGVSLYYNSPNRVPRISFGNIDNCMERALFIYGQEYKVLVNMGLLPLGPSPLNEEEVRKYIMESYFPAYHYTNLCPIGKNINDGVVNKNCKVFGLNGLYVCDTTILPVNATGNTMATAYWVAVVLADKLLSRDF